MRGRGWICLLALFAPACSSSGEGGGIGGKGPDGSISPGAEDAGWNANDANLANDVSETDGGNDANDASDATLAPDATVPGDAGFTCPPGMALAFAEAGAACIDLYEGAIVQVSGDGGIAPWPYFMPVDGLAPGTYRAIPAAGIFPQGYISQVQASFACTAAGKRLCTFDEWTSACRGRPEHDYVYPYGDTYEPGRCNEGKESPILILFGPNPTYSAAELDDPRCDQLEGGLAQGGAYAGCESAYGAFDMHGNIHEWVAELTPSGDGVFLGGYFVDATLNGAGCTYATTAHATTYHDYSTGFRCCADARPGNGD
jgi:sulfatase modifying factor 1